MWCVGLGAGRRFCLVWFDFKFLIFFLPSAFSIAEGFFHLQQTFLAAVWVNKRLVLSLSQWCASQVNICFLVGFLNSGTLEYFVFLSFLLFVFFLS